MSYLKTNYEIVAVGNIQLQTTKDPQIDGILAQNRDAIEEIWQNTQIEKGGKLFNGTLPNFVGVDKKSLSNHLIIKSHFVEYKSFLAQRKRPDLNLGIRPIGVSGVIVLKEAGKEYVVFAKRANDVTEYPAFLELVPSGSIDKECSDVSGNIDYKAKLLSEFSEETGLPKEYVKEISSFAFVLDTNHNVYDICCKILVESAKELFFSEFKRSKEYQSPVAIAVAELADFIKENHESIVPTSMALIDAYMRGAYN